MTDKKKFKKVGEQTKLVLGYIEELKKQVSEQKSLISGIENSCSESSKEIEALKGKTYHGEDENIYFEHPSHKERLFYFAVPSTLTQFCDFIVCPRRLDYIYILAETAPTSSGENLQIDVLVNGTSILEEPILLTQELEDGQVLKVKVKNNKLKLGDTLKANLVYSAGSSPNTLSGIIMNLHYLQIRTN